MLGDYGSVGKRTMLNPSVKIPMLVKWNTGFEQDTRVDTPVSLLDLFPTFASVAGAEGAMPSSEGQDLQKIASGEIDREFVYSQFDERATGLYMIASREYKYIGQST